MSPLIAAYSDRWLAIAFKNVVHPDPGQPRTRHISPGFNNPDWLENDLLSKIFDERASWTYGWIIVESGIWGRMAGTTDSTKRRARLKGESQKPRTSSANDRISLLTLHHIEITSNVRPNVLI